MKAALGAARRGLWTLRLFAKQIFRKTRLADHRFEGSGPDFVGGIVAGDRYKPSLTARHALVLTVAALLPVKMKFMRLKDRYEFSECAFQAGHVTGNSIGPEASRLALREIVARNNRHPQINLTENGASRDSNRERAGSGSASADSTYISIA
jgi:hypothetical protein